MIKNTLHIRFGVVQELPVPVQEHPVPPSLLRYRCIVSGGVVQDVQELSYKLFSSIKTSPRHCWGGLPVWQGKMAMNAHITRLIELQDQLITRIPPRYCTGWLCRRGDGYHFIDHSDHCPIHDAPRVYIGRSEIEIRKAKLVVSSGKKARAINRAIDRVANEIRTAIEILEDINRWI